MPSSGDPVPRDLGIDLAWVAFGGLGLGLASTRFALPFAGAVHAWWASAGLAAILCTSARQRWAVLAAAAWFAFTAADAMAGIAAMRALGHGFAGAAEGLAGASLARRVLRRHGSGTTPLAFALLQLGMASLPPAVGATLDTAWVAWAPVTGADAFGTPATHWVAIWSGDSFGTVGMFPLALSLRRGRHTRADARNALAAVALAIIVVLMTQLAFGTLPRPFAFCSLLLGAAALLAGPRALFLVVWACMAAALGAFGAHLAPPGGASVGWQLLNVFVPLIAIAAPIQVLSISLQRLSQAKEAQLAMRAALECERDELAALTSATSDLAIFLDRDLRYRSVNRAFERYRGLTRREVIGRHQSEVVGQETFDRVFAGPLASALSGEVAQFQAPIDFQLGRRLMEGSAAPAFDAGGRQIGVVLTLHDVTDLVDATRELRLLVDRLQHANEGLEQFARIASHDLREPLNTIAQFAGLIGQDYLENLPAEARRYFALMERAATRMKAMLDDVLEYARLEHLPPVALEPVPLDRVFTELRMLLHARLAQTRARLRVQAPLPAILGQSSLVELLFQNLLLNAMRSTTPGEAPAVDVSAETTGDSVVVTVADNGVGIPEGELERVFSPFHRLHAPRPLDDAGLGLAICRRIVIGLGGRIWAESDGRRGNRFKVALIGHPAS